MFNPMAPPPGAAPQGQAQAQFAPAPAQAQFAPPPPQGQAQFAPPQGSFPGGQFAPAQAPSQAFAPQAQFAPPQGQPAAPWQQQAAFATGAPGVAGGDEEDDFDGVEEAKMLTKSAYFPANHAFTVVLDELKAKKSKKPKTKGQTMVIAEFIVEESSDPTLPPGTRAAQVINMSTYGKPDFKKLIIALMGGNPDDPAHEQHIIKLGVFQKDQVGKVFLPDQPLRKRRLRLRTSMNGKGTFTHHNYRPHEQPIAQ